MTPNLAPTFSQWGEGAYQIPERVRVDDFLEYKVLGKLGQGAYGVVYAGETIGDSYEVAIKFQHVSRENNNKEEEPHEWHVYNELRGCYGLPKIYRKGRVGDYYITVMEKLGLSIRDAWDARGRYISPGMAANIAIQAIIILEKFHTRGYVHGDIKPENFLFGRRGSLKENQLFLIDLGVASTWWDNDSQKHVRCNRKPLTFRGTEKYASIRAHEGMRLSRADDLESLAYTMVFLLRGSLPWDGFKGKDPNLHALSMKTQMSSEAICFACPKPFKELLIAVRTMRHDAKPDYGMLISLFESFLRPSTYRRMLKLHAPQVSRKRKRLLIVPGKKPVLGTEDERPPKRARI
ncbi:casein kinase 1-like protein HD16 [Wolffia australiana]